MSEIIKKLVKETWVDYFTDNKETLKRDENIQKFMDSLVKNNQLSIEEGFIDDNLNNMFYKAYVLKR